MVSDLCALVAKYTAGFKIIIEPFDERLPNVPVSDTRVWGGGVGWGGGGGGGHHRALL